MKLGPGVVIAERYQVERRVGTGAMGEVWAGTRLADGVPVALKVLLSVAANDQESIARFRREAQVLARVRSEYVSQVLDFLIDPDVGMTLVMELIPGDSLHVVLWREKKLPLEMMVPFCADVLHGLSDLHASGIVHRDLKPGNVVIRPMPGGRPRATLIDFGVSRIIAAADEDEVTAITRGDRVLGTLEYMAPEQILSSRAVTFTADLYALGAVMFKALCGAHVFGSLSEGQLAMAKLNQDAPAMPLGRDDQLAVLTTRFVARLLARRSRERFGSTEEALGESVRLVALMERAQPVRFGQDIDEAATMVVGPGELPIPLGLGPAPVAVASAAPLAAPSPTSRAPSPLVEEAWGAAAEVEPPPSSRSPRRPPPLPVGPSSSRHPPLAAPAVASAGPTIDPWEIAAPTSSRLSTPSSGPWPTEAQADLPRPRRRRRGRWRTPVVVVSSLTLGIVGGGFFSRSYAEGGAAARWVQQLRTLLAGDAEGTGPAAESAGFEHLVGRSTGRARRGAERAAGGLGVGQCGAERERCWLGRGASRGAQGARMATGARSGPPACRGADHGGLSAGNGHDDGHGSCAHRGSSQPAHAHFVVSHAMQQTAARVVVVGRVQGVCFRAATRETALYLGLRGWVRNRSDGSVEAWLEGERVAVEQMVAWCRRGPDQAHVARLEHSWEEPTGCPDFRVTR